MKKISTIEFSASLDTIRSAVSTGTLSPELLEPLQSLVTPLIEQITKQPTGVYLLSSDENKELRDLVGSCLAVALLPHFKTTLLVDSDFLNVGMGDIVPQKDSLGFLDLLLYGSSMKAIVQRTEGGFFVIGAGSFQVTKKLPFSIESFRNAVRYLLNQAQCVIFSGPAEDDAGTAQPMAESLNTIIYVRQIARSGGVPLDQLEAKLTPMDDAHLFTVSVILDTSAKRETMPVQAPPAPPAGLPEEKPELTPAEEELPARSARHAAADSGLRGPETKAEQDRDDAGEAGRAGDFYTWETVEEPHAREARNSLVAKIAMGVIPIVLVAFLFWWLFYTKPYRATSTPPEDHGSAAVLTDSADTTAGTIPAGTIPLPMEITVGEQSAEAVPETIQEAAPETVLKSTEPINKQQVTQITATAAKPEETGLVVYDDLVPVAGKFLIHISSFRAVDNAKVDARYLAGKGFAVFIARIDLGAKGIWYRVYSGPFDTRDQARENKMNLDNLDRVKFSRIIKAPQ